MNPVPAAPTPQPKKGMSGLAIAGFGCLGLVLLFMLGAGFLVMKGCSWIKSSVGDFQKNPEKATAMLLLKANPNVEVLSSDDATGEITIKDKTDGDVVTISYKDVAQGRLKIKNSKGEEVTIDPTNQGGKGSVVVKNNEGTTVIGGDPTQTAPPPWVPMYPGVTFQPGGMRSEKDGKVEGLSMSETPDALPKVREFYETRLKALGFDVTTSTYSSDQGDVSTVTGAKDSEEKKVNAVVRIENGKTSLALQYEGPK